MSVSVPVCPFLAELLSDAVSFSFDIHPLLVPRGDRLHQLGKFLDEIDSKIAIGGLVGKAATEARAMFDQTTEAEIDPLPPSEEKKIPMQRLMLLLPIVGINGMYLSNGEASRANRGKRVGLFSYLSAMDSGKHAHVLRDVFDLLQAFPTVFPNQPNQTQDIHIEKMYVGLPLLFGANFPSALLAWVCRFPGPKEQLPSSKFCCLMMHIYRQAIALQGGGSKKRKAAGQSGPASQLPVVTACEQRLPCYWLWFLAKFGHLLFFASCRFHIAAALRADGISVPVEVDMNSASEFVHSLLMCLRALDDRDRDAFNYDHGMPIHVEHDDFSGNTSSAPTEAGSPPSSPRSQPASQYPASDIIEEYLQVDQVLPYDETPAIEASFDPIHPTSMFDTDDTNSINSNDDEPSSKRQKTSPSSPTKSMCEPLFCGEHPFVLNCSECYPDLLFNDSASADLDSFSSSPFSPSRAQSSSPWDSAFVLKMV